MKSGWTNPNQTKESERESRIKNQESLSPVFDDDDDDDNDDDV